MQRILLSLFILLFSRSTAQIIPASRTTDWNVAGHEGGIPEPSNVIDVTTFGAMGDSSTNNYPFIVNAINSLGGNAGVIYFPPGNYIMQSTISLPDSVVIRGQCSDSTHLIFDLGGAAGNSFTISGSASAAPINVLSAYDKGSSSIIVANSAGFTAGDFMEIEEDNGTWDTQPVSWADRSMGQILRIDSVSGDTLFFHQPLRFTYDSALNVKVRKFTPVKEAGIECLSIERRDSVSSGLCIGIYMYHAYNCWIRGVESRRSVGSHIEADNSSHIEITGCFIHHSFAYDGVSTHGYGITLFKHTCESKLENNIMRFLRHSFSLQCGANGNVIAYNYSREPNRTEFPSNAGADISMHGHYPYLNLFEGNIVQNIQIDQTWGPSGPFNTFFRNRAELYGILMSSATVQSDSQNFVGNEITNLVYPPYGNYSLVGSGHLEHGNNVRGTITPVGTDTVNDVSYYLSAQPPFWNSSPFPSIGAPNPFGGESIPAKDRYSSGISLTVCNSLTVGSPENNPGDFFVFPNPVKNQLTAILSRNNNYSAFTITDISGKEVYKKDISENETAINVNTSMYAAGIYFINLSARNGFSSAAKFVKE
jgi:hypothetical protein